MTLMQHSILRLLFMIHLLAVGDAGIRITCRGKDAKLCQETPIGTSARLQSEPLPPPPPPPPPPPSPPPPPLCISEERRIKMLYDLGRNPIFMADTAREAGLNFWPVFAKLEGAGFRGGPTTTPAWPLRVVEPSPADIEIIDGVVRRTCNNQCQIITNALKPFEEEHRSSTNNHWRYKRDEHHENQNPFDQLHFPQNTKDSCTLFPIFEKCAMAGTEEHPGLKR
ncbi:unnamed protein product, partial [Cylicocyclus nassatus]